MSAPEPGPTLLYVVVNDDHTDERTARLRGRQLLGGAGYSDLLASLYLDDRGLPTPPFNVYLAYATGPPDVLDCGGVHAESWQCVNDRPESLAPLFGEYAGSFLRTMNSLWYGETPITSAQELERCQATMVQRFQRWGTRVPISQAHSNLRSVLGLEAEQRQCVAEVEAALDWMRKHPKFAELLARLPDDYHSHGTELLSGLVESLIVQGVSYSWDGAVSLLRSGYFPVLVDNDVHLFSTEHPPTVTSAGELAVVRTSPWTTTPTSAAADASRPSINRDLPPEMNPAFVVPKFVRQMDRQWPATFVSSRPGHRQLEAVDNLGQVLPISIEFSVASKTFAVHCPSRGFSLVLSANDIARVRAGERVEKESWSAEGVTHTPSGHPSHMIAYDRWLPHDRIHIEYRDTEIHFPVYYFPSLQRAAQELGE